MCYKEAAYVLSAFSCSGYCLAFILFYCCYTYTGNTVKIGKSQELIKRLEGVLSVFLS